MKNVKILLSVLPLAAGCCLASENGWAAGGSGPETPAIRLITLDPGHFHAALLQKQMWPGVSDTVHIYAPLGPDLLAHLDRIRQFNLRPTNPTRWNLEIHACSDSLERLLAEKPGNVVILSGANRGKIDRIATLIGAGFHVLADKPWILETAEIATLKAALRLAEDRGVAACDAMTQRFEITCLLQRELVNDHEIFGECVAGSPAEPAVRIESVHYLLKEVAGVVNRRPPWFFDVRQQGEALTDVGTHLVDLVQWTLFPERAIDCDADVRVLKGRRWPTSLTPEQYLKVTGERAPPFLINPIPNDASAPEAQTAASSENRLEYYANNSVLYTLRGIYVAIRATWEFEAPPGEKDTEMAAFQGTLSRIEVRQGREERFRPEIYVTPNSSKHAAEVAGAVRRHIAQLRERYPGLGFDQADQRVKIVIPDSLRIGHEEHFALLTSQCLEYVRSPDRIPHWERPNMIAKYYVTTKGVELARRSPETTPPAAKGN